MTLYVFQEPTDIPNIEDLTHGTLVIVMSGEEWIKSEGPDSFECI